MATTTPTRLIVVGGSGYLGSSICRAALTRANTSSPFTVQSISSSGNPPLTPGGHLRAWTNSVEWLSASAFDPETYRDLMKPSFEGEKVAVVHTLGTLLPGGGYKKAVRGGDVMGLVSNWWGAMTGGEDGVENPLMRGLQDKGKGKEMAESDFGYDRMNRQSALTVLSTLLSTIPSTSTSPTPFIYISAEDIFRPLIPPGYVLSKRAAERDLWRMVWEWGKEHGAEGGAIGEKGVRPVFIRPGLMYHPHIRPLSTPLAVALDLTSRVPFPSPSSPPHLPLSPLTALTALGQSLAIPPIHVDHVAECVIRSVEMQGLVGVVGAKEMRRWVGLDEALQGEEGRAGHEMGSVGSAAPKAYGVS